MYNMSNALKSYSKNWWVFLIRGIIAVIFGILAFAFPSQALVTLVLLFGIYAFTDGLTAIWTGGSSRSWWLLSAGIIGFLIGIMTFFYPGITAITLLYLIAFWTIVKGFFEIVSAIQLRKEIDNEWMLMLGGIFSILFGFILLFDPLSGTLAMIFIIGSFALTFGVMMIIFAFRLKRLDSQLEKHLEKSKSVQGAVINGTITSEMPKA